MESQIFSCQLSKTKSVYYVIISASISDINPNMIVCQDNNIIIVEYNKVEA